MTLRSRGLAGLARQLGHPHGLGGRLVGRRLNRSNRSAVAAAADALAMPAAAAAADLGFGGGVGLELLLSRLPAGRVHGVDVSATMLAAARRRFRSDIAAGRLALHEAPIERLPLPSGSLDGAITINTMYFLSDLATALTECTRVLKPGGRLVVGLGDPEAMAQLPFTAYGFRIRPVDEVISALSVAGLSLVDHRRVGEDARAYHLLVAERRSAAEPVEGPG